MTPENDLKRASRRWWRQQHQIDRAALWALLAAVALVLAGIRAVSVWFYDTILVQHDPLWILFLIGLLGAVMTIARTEV